MRILQKTVRVNEQQTEKKAKRLYKEFNLNPYRSKENAENCPGGKNLTISTKFTLRTVILKKIFTIAWSDIVINMNYKMLELERYSINVLLWVAKVVTSKRLSD